MPTSVDFKILAAAVALASLTVVYGTSRFLQLERAFPPTHQVELDSLRARDGLRHAIILHCEAADGRGGREKQAVGAQ